MNKIKILKAYVNKLEIIHIGDKCGQYKMKKKKLINVSF